MVIINDWNLIVGISTTTKQDINENLQVSNPPNESADHLDNVFGPSAQGHAYQVVTEVRDVGGHTDKRTDTTGCYEYREDRMQKASFRKQNEYIRWNLKVALVTEIFCDNPSLWYGHVIRKNFERNVLKRNGNEFEYE